MKFSQSQRPAPWLLILLGCLVSCGSPDEQRPPLELVSEIRENRESPFFLDVAGYPTDRKRLPVGVFDSGTGGLTVLNVILQLDGFLNGTLEAVPDRIPDFSAERFVYLGDSANMPYGRYSAEGKVDLLREHIVKDGRFLLGGKYYIVPGDRVPEGTKDPVKAIVIACNTATAYGLQDLRCALTSWGLDVPVIGVIDAGAAAAVAGLEGDGKGCVLGVLATEGTCASGGYPRAIQERFQKKFGHRGIRVIQQAGLGFAGAVDGDPSYIDAGAAAPRGPGIYKGPAPGHAGFPVEPALWQDYNFDETGSGLLLEQGPDGEVLRVELNSVKNYIRYHTTSLVRKTLMAAPDRKLAGVILGCTHYPYFTGEIRNHFRFLRRLREEYARLIPEDIALIDPARSTARELYLHLAGKELLRTAGRSGCEFYTSVPNPLLPENRIDEKGSFLYAWKYGREVDQGVEFVKRVPFTRQWIKPATLQRIKEKMPLVHAMMRAFHTREIFKNYPVEVLFQ